MKILLNPTIVFQKKMENYGHENHHSCYRIGNEIQKISCLLNGVIPLNKLLKSYQNRRKRLKWSESINSIETKSRLLHGDRKCSSGDNNCFCYVSDDAINHHYMH